MDNQAKRERDGPHGYPTSWEGKWLRPGEPWGVPSQEALSDAYWMLARWVQQDMAQAQGVEPIKEVA